VSRVLIHDGRSLLSGLFLFFVGCAHVPTASVPPAEPLDCPQGWERCLYEDITALAAASRVGTIKPWMNTLTQAIRRSRTQDVAVLLRYFSPPAQLLDALTARQLIAALAVHDEATVAGIAPGATRRSLERVWLNHYRDPASEGEISSWLMVSGFESSRGAALARVDPPQRKFDPKALVATPLGERPWRTIHRARGKSLIYPQDWTFPTRQRCQHLVAAFRIKEPARLSLRGGDERRVWLNNKPLVEFAGLESGLQQAVQLTDTLKAGVHQLEIRSCPRVGAGAFQVLAHREDGRLVALESIEPKARLTPLANQFERFDAERYAETLYREVSHPGLGRLLRAARLADLGRASDAIALLESAKEPSLAELLIALQLAINNRRKELVMTAAKGLGDDLAAKVWQANALLSLQQSDRAARMVLPRLADFDGFNRRAQITVGKLIQRQAPKGSSYRYWLKVVERDPQWPYAINRLRKQLEALGEKDQAKERIKALRQAQPGARDLKSHRREQAQSENRLSDALALVDELIRFDELDIGRRLTRASLLISLNRFDEAVKSVETLLVQNPYSVGALRWMAEQFAARQGADQAQPYLRRLAGVQPDHGQVIKAERYAALRFPKEEIQIPHWHRPSQTELELLVKERAKHRPTKAVSQVLLLDDHLDLIQADGSRRQVVTLVRWFLDRGAAQRFLKINLSGLRNRQIHHAYLVQPNGQRVDPVSQRGGKIRFREIGPESVLVLQYESTSQPSRLINGLIEGSFWFESSDAHAVKARFTLASARVDQTPKFTVVGPKPALKKAAAKGISVWSFERNDVGPAVMEINIQAPWRYRSQIRFSTMPKWEPYVGWVRDLFRQSGKITPKVSERATSLVKGAGTTEDKIDAIYRFAVEQIQYEQDYARVIEGWEPHLPDQVLDRSYGDCKDKSMLIISMLRSLGIQAELALIRTWRLGDIDRSLPGSQFNHAVVYLPQQAGVAKARFMDATAEYLDRDNLRIDIQGTDALVIDDKDWKWITVPQRPAAEELTRIELEHQGERLWKAKMVYRGHTAGMIRRVGKGDKQRFLMQNVVTGAFWPGSELVEGRVEEIDERLHLNLTLRAPAQLLKRDGAIDLPLVIKRVWAQRFAQSERKLPLRISSSRSTDVVVSSRVGAFERSAPLRSASDLHQGSWSCSEGKCSFSMRIVPLVIPAQAYLSLGQSLRDFQTQLADQKIRLKQRI